MAIKSLRVTSGEVESAAQSEVVLGDADSHTEIFRIVSMNALPVSIGVGEWAADWGRVEWDEMKRVGDSLASAICHIKEIARDQIKFQEIQSDPSSGQSVASVAYYASADLASQLADSISSIVCSFMGRVTGGNPTAALFGAIHLSEDEELCVEEHARNFLKKNGDKNIGVPIRLKQGAAELGEYKGRFAKKPASTPLESTGTHETVGIITMADATNRIFRLVDTAGMEFKIHFSSDTDRAQIFDSARDGVTCSIQWQLHPRLKGDPTHVMVGIDQIDSEWGFGN